MKINETRYYIWGTGERAKHFNKIYAEVLNRTDVAGYIDNNSEKWGELFYGKPIFSPDVLKNDGEKHIIISCACTKEIEEQIKQVYSEYNCYIEDARGYEKLQIFNRYEHQKDKEIQEIIQYLKKHPLQVFNYEFVEKYKAEELNVLFDCEKKMYFAYYEGKKMYFSRELDTEEKVRRYYRSILLEQDDNSPHKYLTTEFDVPNDAVVVDAGVAEGNFSLSIVDKVKKIYLFEPDKNWIEALRYTFEPYKEKVEIIEKCLSDYVTESTTTIDEALSGVKLDFIKMDIEGEEYYALKGARHCIENSQKLKCVICTYHQEFVYYALKELMETFGINTATSKGYMWYPSNSVRTPSLRRGLLRGEKL